MGITFDRRLLEDDAKGGHVVCTAHSHCYRWLEHWISSFPEGFPGQNILWQTVSAQCSAVLIPLMWFPDLNPSHWVQPVISFGVLTTTLSHFFPVFSYKIILSSLLWVWGSLVLSLHDFSSLLWLEPYFVSQLHLELYLWFYLGFCFVLFVVCLVLFCFVWAFFISKSEFGKVNILALIISMSGEEFKSLCRSILILQKVMQMSPSDWENSHWQRNEKRKS